MCLIPDFTKAEQFVTSLLDLSSFSSLLSRGEGFGGKLQGHKGMLKLQRNKNGKCTSDKQLNVLKTNKNILIISSNCNKCIILQPSPHCFHF